MKTDYELLGIAETDDLAAVRAAYRKAAKAVHPDLGAEDDSLRNHLVFIQITKAYERLVERLSRSPARPSSEATVQRVGETGIVAHKDPAYAYYKTAMRCFGKIHPSYWRLDVRNALQMPSPAREQELSRIQSRMRELVTLFPKAYYYFSMVVHEHPESIWVQDARDKMRQIEERTPLYERIIASFTEHARRVPRVNRMF